MTRYEKGFIEKCAEYGIDGVSLLKKAEPTSLGKAYAEIANNVRDNNILAILTGGLGGAAIGDIQSIDDRKKRLKNIITGALVGAGGAYIGTRNTKPLVDHIGDIYHELDKVNEFGNSLKGLLPVKFELKKDASYKEAAVKDLVIGALRGVRRAKNAVRHTAKIVSGDKRKQAIEVGARMMDRGVELGSATADEQRMAAAIRILQAALKFKDAATKLPRGL